MTGQQCPINEGVFGCMRFHPLPDTRFLWTNGLPQRTQRQRKYVKFIQSACSPERWPSGLRRTLGKRVYFNEYRGFESHSLRQKYLL